jgi:uncharacterized membrane protein
MATAATALPTVVYVKINGDEFESGDQLVVERGEKLDIKVKLQAANQTEENIEVEADILGYEYSDHEEISDSSHTFDMDPLDTQYASLRVTIPEKVDKDFYDLRVRVGTRTGPAFEGLYRLNIKGQRHRLSIKDVIFRPERVKAGSNLFSLVRVKNIGERDEEGIKITVSVPELGASAQDSDYIDELEADESTTSEELWIRIPACADPGLYQVYVKVEYDEGYEELSATELIEVLESDACEAAPILPVTPTITYSSQTQDIVQGQGVVYPVTITNPARSSRSFTVIVNTGDWATSKVSPSNVLVVGAGQTQTAYVYVYALPQASPGEHLFAISITDATGATVQDIPLKANVVGTTTDLWPRVRRALETALIVLVVLLVILGMIIAFNRLRGREEELEEAETYY